MHTVACRAGKGQFLNTRTLTGPLKSRWIDGQTYFSATLSRAKLFVLANKFKLDVLDRGSCEA
jgi:hypothetical protein